MWFLPAAFSGLAVFTLFVAYGVAGFAPDELPFTIPQDAVSSVLNVLASSLLTVAVFALSSMVAALSSASQATTPRAVPLIIGDRQAQTSISVFIGAFLFSVLGIIGLSVEVYSEAGRLILFFVTLAVVLLVIMALVRWIGQVSQIGRVGQTIDRTESATGDAFAIAESPSNFGCLARDFPAEGDAIFAAEIGYVQSLDVQRLQTIAEDQGLMVHVTARPGAYVDHRRPLARIVGAPNDACRDDLRKSFVVGDMRTFDSDPRFGLVVLGEIASKALSPGINDPGTSIDVIGTATRVIAGWKALEPGEIRHDRLSIEPLVEADLIEDVFRPIARDGAAMIEVVLRLLSALETIEGLDPNLEEPARMMAGDVNARAMAALTADTDRTALERMMASHFAP